jgi:hypothetical protein
VRPDAGLNGRVCGGQTRSLSQQRSKRHIVPSSRNVHADLAIPRLESVLPLAVAADKAVGMSHAGPMP